VQIVQFRSNFVLSLNTTLDVLETLKMKELKVKVTARSWSQRDIMTAKVC